MNSQAENVGKGRDEGFRDSRSVGFSSLPGEHEVLELMAEGCTKAAINSALVIGTGAVEKNVTAIFQMLGPDGSGTDHRGALAVLAWLQR